MIPIIPAIIPKSQTDLQENLARLSFSQEVHVDVVDGKFVSQVSWPYEPRGEESDIKSETDKFTLEVDLMVEDPLTAAEAWVKAGADMLVFHTEHISPEAFKRFCDTTSVSVGIAAVNDTSLETLKQYLDAADYLQLMGIAKVGAQGQPFDERVLDRIKEIKSLLPNTLISIDGSVNKDTIKLLAEAGADRFICGSAITGAENPAEAHAALSKLIN